MSGSVGPTPDEVTLNVTLAQLLQNRGLRALGEARIYKQKLRKPDVRILLNGIRIILEGKFRSSGIEEQLEVQCRNRIDEGLCEICIAVLYPQFRSGKLEPTMEDVKSFLRTTRMDIKCMWISGLGIRDTGWISCETNELAEIVRNSYTAVIGEDIVGEAAKSLSQALDDTLQMWGSENSEVLADRLKEVLQLPTNETAGEEDEA